MIGHDPGRMSSEWPGSFTVTAALLVAVNLIPLVGVLSFGWDLLSLLILYWLESGVVGLINIPKMVRAQGPPAATPARVRGGRVFHANDVPLVAFFVLHYGIFWIVHGVFVFVLPLMIGRQPGFDYSALSSGVIGIGLIGLVISHVGSYFYNFLGRREYLKVSPEEQMFRPYGRVLVLHLTILGGTFLVASLGTPMALLVLMVVLKIVIDLVLHVLEHRGGAPAAAPVLAD